jgi:hypothetical protein
MISCEHPSCRQWLSGCVAERLRLFEPLVVAARGPGATADGPPPTASVGAPGIPQSRFWRERWPRDKPVCRRDVGGSIGQIREISSTNQGMAQARPTAPLQGNK